MAIIFRRKYSDGTSRLLEAQVDGAPGRLLLVLPQDTTVSEVDFATAWDDDKYHLQGSFVYAAGTIGETRETASTLIAAVLGRVQAAGAPRGYVWLADPDAWRAGGAGLNAANTPVLGLSLDGRTAVIRLVAPIAGKAILSLNAGATFTVESSGVRIAGNLAIGGPGAVSTGTGLLGSLPETLGVIAFPCSASYAGLRSCRWGFQYAYPNPQGGVARYQWIVVFGGATGNVQFDAALDLSDPLNAYARAQHRALRSKMAFAANAVPGGLTTPLRTREGQPVTLYPAKASALVFDQAVDGSAQLAPAGDFEMSCASSAEPALLLCGQLGTEVMTFRSRGPNHPGDTLRFTPYQPAHAPTFPLPEVSPVTTPPGSMDVLLDDVWTTSWVTVVSERGEEVRYTSQPAGAPLYGQVPDETFMSWKAISVAAPSTVAYPLLPYAALQDPALHGGSFMPADNIPFERQILAPTRRRRIPTGGTLASEPPYTAVTPSGQLVSVVNGRWQRILLAQNLDVKPKTEFAFEKPEIPLQQAFQSGELLLVGVNPAPLGTFTNTVTIGGWQLRAAVGNGNRYGDYRNVLIVKGRTGRLYDPVDPAASLVANPQLWTAPDTFSKPGTRPDEMVALAQWLLRYFAAAARSTDPALGRFNAVARDEHWAGTLVLRADIAAVPDDLAGIVAGVADPGGFNAHHLGLELTPVSTVSGDLPGPSLDGTTAMFGLINYNDSALKPDEPVRAVAPLPGQVYNFRLLRLRVAFAATAVASFQAAAQLSAGAWFDTPISLGRPGTPPYGAILLTGTLQDDDGQPVYCMAADRDSVFGFNHEILDRLDITGAVMSTRDTGRSEGTDKERTLARSWFGLTGALSFKTPHAVDRSAPGGGYPVDLFSYDRLAFANLGVLMTYPPDSPSEAVLALVADETRFDATISTARAGSLSRQFCLDVVGLRSGNAKNPPSAAGFVPVVTNARLTGVDGGRWWGVEYRLPLGTPGSLAGNSALTARLLTAWVADPTRGLGLEPPPDMFSAGSLSAAVAVSLPGSDGGAKFVDLQSVLRLSVGQIRLWYTPDPGAFVLLFSEIALKLYGLLSIPPGSTLASLYGDPSGRGNPSGLAWYASYHKRGGTK